MCQPLYCSVANAAVWGERISSDAFTPYTWLSSIRLASMVARLSYTSISHHRLLPYIPSLCFSTVNIGPHPVIPSQSPNSRSQAWVQGTHFVVQGVYGCGKDCLILILFRLPQYSCFSGSLKCFLSDSDNYPDVGIGPLLQFPHPPWAAHVLLTLLVFLLVPSSW